MAEEDALYAFQHKCGVLTTPMPEDFGEIQTVEQVKKRAKWDNDDYVCRGLILNGMFDFLFDIYQNVETSKELWDTLEAKYMAEDASSKKFLVSCIIDKLPPSWKDFKYTLKHLKEELTLIELGSHLCIEESLRVQDSDKTKGNNVAGLSVVNMVEHNNCSRIARLVMLAIEPMDQSLKDQRTDNDVAWWIDYGATVHVCKDRCWFKTYESLNDGSIVYMGNKSTALVHRCGCVDIRHIQVKDIVKEFEDYLKTYSSAGMDINCRNRKAFTDKSQSSVEVFKEIQQLSYNSISGRGKNLSVM
nr:hypothetical protein [Tanacetum cinerariifolium]